jgi:cell division septation protein DedD
VSIRADQAISAPQTRVASARSATGAPVGAPPASGGAPLALTPQAVNAAAAVVGSTDATHARTRPPGGGFVVQVSAQKSESEVEASFHAMQTRYTVLGGRQPLIRRKDQGERGVFYVAQVGPFGTKDEASQLCETLKTEGGTCFVQKN